MSKPRIILDFDGVIHSYPSWKGIIPTDPPTPGAAKAIQKLRQNYEVCVLSTRCTEEAGVEGIRLWLGQHNIAVDRILTTKEKAVLMVDDRGYRFDGDWDALLAFVADGVPEPWNRHVSFFSAHCVVSELTDTFVAQREVYLRGPQYCGGDKFTIAHVFPEAIQDAIATGGLAGLPQPVQDFIAWCSQNTVASKA